MKRNRDESAEDAPEPSLPSLQALDDARRAYNVGVGKQSEVAGLDWKTAMAQGEDVNRKTKEFCSCFARSIRANDVMSGKPILADMQQFEARYRTVFRESSKGLEMQVHARAVFLPTSRRASSVFVLDLERHASLVTPVGPKLDGSLGLRGPRTQWLWVLYEMTLSKVVDEGKVVSMEMCGWKPEAGELGPQALARLRRANEWAAFEEVVRGRLGAEWTLRTGPLHSAQVGRCELQGKRPTMEDTLAIEHIAAPQVAWPAAASLLFLGLYDGHGGGACAAAVADGASSSSVHAHLAAAAEMARGEVGAALSQAFAQTDRAWLRDGEGNSGACALVAVLGGGKLLTAHVGDSRAVLCTGEGGRAVRLTEDHKPDRPDEAERIRGLGGDVVLGGRCWRVSHSGTSLMLATSRSLGDKGFKESWHATAAAAAVAAADAAHEAAQGEEAEAAEAAAEAAEAAAAAAVEAKSAAPDLLSAVPEVSERAISPEDRFVILACDGVWDVLSDGQAVDVVAAVLAQPDGGVQSAAKKLCSEAFERGSEDNISALVVLLQPYLA